MAQNPAPDENEELGNVKLPFFELKVRKRHLKLLFWRRFDQPPAALPEPPKQKVRFEALSIEEDPEFEVLDATRDALEACISTAYGALKIGCPRLTREEIRANCFRFSCHNAMKGTLGELLPIRDGNLQFASHSRELKTKWQLGEDVAAIQSFTRKVCWSLDAKLLGLQARLIGNYAGRAATNHKWVVCIPIVDAETNLAMGVVALDSLRTPATLEQLKHCHRALMGHGDSIAKAWSSLPKTRVLIASYDQ